MSLIIKISVLTIVFSLFYSCDKSKIRMTIIKNCTGTYLRDNSRDYYVCNSDLLDSYPAGEKVKVSYSELEECFGILDTISCEMTQPYNGKIEITEIF
jgi:hypothetical protein